MNKNNIRYFIILLLFTAGYGTYSQELVDGSSIFALNCAACHTIGQGQLIGPDLKGVNEKYDKSWITRFIRESQTMVAEGDKNAVAVFEANNMIPMPAMPLNDAQMNAILEFIARESNGELEPATASGENKVVASPSASPSAPGQIQRTIPEDQREANRRSMMIGFWVAFAAASIMGIGIWWATR